MTVPQQLSNYINGRLQAPLSGNYLEHINPATGEVAGHLPDSGHRDIQEAVNAAKAAFPAWSNTSPEERFTLLNRIADLITQYQEVLALAETNDNGKPITLSRTIDIPRAAANFRFFATAIMHFASEAHGMEDRGINYTLRQPVGVVGGISPWNLPLYLFTWKIAPALAAGNCVIAKPSEVTPVTSYLLSLICQEAGLPPGVLNIVHGTGPTAGEAIVTHPDVKAISFTGSTRAGERIASLAAPKFKKLSLELGGKNPALIFADCDWDKMMKETLRSAFANQGEICLCTSRILIEASIYDRFRNEFIEKASQMIPGDPLDDERRQGAVVSKAHQDKIQRCIDTAKQEGGRIACGGKSVQPVGRCANGYFVQPTIIEGLGPDSQTNQEEIFGPVVTLQAFHSEEEALQLANASTYGLAATIWTQDLSRAGRLAAKVEAGIIWVNCWLLRDLRTPFGGVKNSGVGREGGWEALRFFTEPRNVCISF